MKTDDLRDSYLEFFRKKGHVLIASDSLVPINDPTLLFTGAGMNQFKENFLGVKKDLKRATSSQKCLRTGDLDNVGKTAFHHSFFEMLGNFSFGDYFKEDAIIWAWEYLTQVLKIAPGRLRISIHQSDEEAYRIWRDQINIPEAWIYRLGDKSNFWPSNAPADGPNGPCGPCSEIYYDQDPSSGNEDIESSRFAEIWNLVFTQFDRRDGGQLVPLAQKNIDTGMGLERLACVMQGKKTNFETDNFQVLNEAICRNLHVSGEEVSRSSLYTIADHVRAVTFAIADGVIPSNDGRGYVIRKLIRRAIWHAHQIVPGKRLEKPFLSDIVPIVARIMRKPYPELSEAEGSIAATLCAEEKRFLDTLETGLKLLSQRLKKVREGRLSLVSGEIVFELYDTYGFPDELTKTIAESEGLDIDQAGFDRLMEEQRRRAKDSTQIASEIFVTTELEKEVAALPSTRFLGYEKLESDGKVLYLQIKDGRGVIVLDQTPFYGESGGQSGDVGSIEALGALARVADTQKKDGRVLHQVEILQGNFSVGMSVMARVDAGRRFDTMRNHTATHLLHSALRKVLGTQARQLGSLVNADKLRFDYSWGQALTQAQCREIERSVNEQILANTPVKKEVKSIAEAKSEGALAFFGDKYGDTVRVLTIGDFSKELCGGTHCDRTGDIGVFIVTAETSVASGTRRIEAVTGTGALAYVSTLREQMDAVTDRLRTSAADAVNRIVKLQDAVKKLEKEKSQVVVKRLDAQELLARAQSVGGHRGVVFFSEGMSAQELRSLADDLRSKDSESLYFLGTGTEDKIQYLLTPGASLVKKNFDARSLAKKIDAMIQGRSGGNLHLIQGGAPRTGVPVDMTERIAELMLTELKEFVK